MSKRYKPDLKGRFGDLDPDQAAQDVTGQEKSQSFSLEDTRSKKRKHDLGLTKKGRKKFTTMLRPDLKDKLDNVAENNAISIADVLETVIKEYFGIKE